jgi:hypothetical protein
MESTSEILVVLISIHSEINRQIRNRVLNLTAEWSLFENTESEKFFLKLPCKFEQQIAFQLCVSCDSTVE